MKLIKVIIIVLLAVVCVFIGTRNENVSVNQTIKHADAKVYATNDKNVFVVTKDSVMLLDGSGKERWSDKAQYKFISHEKNVIGLADDVGDVHIFNTSGKVCEYKVNPPLYFSVNESGFSTAITKNNNGYEISVYDVKGEKVLAYVHEEANVYPISACVSNDSKSLIVSYIDTNNMKVDSKITFIKLDKTNDIFASIQETDAFVFNTQFVKDNVICVSNNKMFCYNGTYKKKWTISFDKLNRFAYNDNSIAIANEKTVTLYNISNGNKLSEFEMPGTINYLYSGLNCFILGSNNNFVAIDSKGKELWKYTAIGDERTAIFLNDTRKLLLLSKSQIRIVNVKRSGDL